jgi:hypothetical protein
MDPPQSHLIPIQKLHLVFLVPTLISTSHIDTRTFPRVVNLKFSDQHFCIFKISPTHATRSFYLATLVTSEERHTL